MTKLKWDRHIGVERADRFICTTPSPLVKQLQILRERKELLEITKRRGLLEKRKAKPNLVLLTKLREQYFYHSRLVRASNAAVEALQDRRRNQH